MKVHEILLQEELPAFLRKQAGPLLTTKDRKKIAKKIYKGQKPALLKRQAESVE